MSAKSATRIPSLDGIRATAALIVFLSHNGLEDLVPGGFGVSIFFFLSGYLISTLLRIEFEKTGEINLKNFYLRRVFRIFPPFYIILLLSAVPPIGHLGPETTSGAIAAQVLHFSNYYIVFFGTVHLIPMTAMMWSLAIEEHFYLIFPVCLLWMLRRFSRAKITAVLLATCALVLIWRFILVFKFGFGNEYIYYATDTRLDSLLFGCIMAIGANPVLDKQCLPFTPRFWAYLVAASFACLFLCLVFRDPHFRDTVRYTLQGIGLFSVFFCAIRYDKWLIFRWLEHPWMRGLGLISYTFYLSHHKGLQMAGRLFSHEPIVKGIVGFVFTVAFSTAMYFLIERPLADLRRRL